MKRTLIAEKKEVTESSNHIFKLFFTSLLLISMTSFGQVKLPQLIQDGMVLQRDARVKIWGWTSVGEKVALHFNKQSLNVIARCENSKIRQFKVFQVYDFNSPKDDYSSGNWVPVTSKTILDYSAVAYFFARDLYEKYDVPIGIINASVGGSPAEAWMSVE